MGYTSRWIQILSNSDSPELADEAKLRLAAPPTLGLGAARVSPFSALPASLAAISQS